LSPRSLAPAPDGATRRLRLVPEPDGPPPWPARPPLGVWCEMSQQICHGQITVLNNIWQYWRGRFGRLVESSQSLQNAFSSQKVTLHIGKSENGCSGGGPLGHTRFIIPWGTHITNACSNTCHLRWVTLRWVAHIPDLTLRVIDDKDHNMVSSGVATPEGKSRKRRIQRRKRRGGGIWQSPRFL
jgi:hypothetical protein